MLFEDPSRRYPHLTQALNTLGGRRFEVSGNPVPFYLVAGGLVTSLTLSQQWHGLVSFLPFLASIGAAAYIGSRPRPKPEFDPRTVEATRVAQGMGVMLAKRRLHRDLDEGSLTLLEECARQWLRAKSALDAPFWTDGQVPLHYQSVRSQALTALDESMDDVLLHYRAFVPQDVPNRHALDYVDEALEQFTFKGAKRGHFTPPMFGPVREIAEKLRQLANEAEQLGNEVRVDPEIAAKAEPGRSLDQTLSELREIRQAEEELRQNLRS